MSSILTNNGAIVALQTLKNVNSNLNKAQSEIATGKSVSNAKDNAAVWAISKVMEADESAFKTIQANLNMAGAVVATARGGAEQISNLLREMKDLAIGANNDAADFTKISADIQAKKLQINAIVDGTQMNGVNLLKTAPTPSNTNYTVLGSLNRTSGTPVPAGANIEVASAGFEAAIQTPAVTAITNRATAVTALGEIEGLLNIAVNGAAALGTAGKRISDQADFVGKQADSLKVGIGSLVDADMEEASARLQALQTQQQLGIQALSIANQAPSAVLSLFR